MAMTPSDAAAKLDRLPPALVKPTLVELLEWQAQHNKRIINLAWYLNTIFFEQEPRLTKRGTDGRAKVAALVKRAGG